MKTISRRSFLKVSAGGIAAVGLAGCAGAAPTTAPAAPAATAAPAGPAKGGTAVIAIDSDPESRNLGIT